MTIAAVLSGKPRDIATIRQDSTLGAAAAELARRRIGALVVVDEAGEVVGVLSERDIVACLAEHGDSRLGERPVAEAMTAPAITVLPTTLVLSALALMTRRRIRHLPVMQDGRLTGLVSIGDLVKYRIEHIEREAEAMRSYIQSA
ncbi:CBS domain-containing protein [Sphingomonas astaxanthinifaciens]|uniref:Inosine-5-monophosphate dehydrogenase n=1 Tax=Sphingomonas astaxanthinifaciens DSM 22298 TaxID=1123267 RepID=A0ABQ5Z7P1_9SPHN|nr:CBS domain-containing protein [Sphingomonas astaxanthinifaciens]GLR47562.1 inosine-5-monophosphate dehydrogenase [Sphingomonas astaxanthinifaciens DSM 22298]